MSGNFSVQEARIAMRELEKKIAQLLNEYEQKYGVNIQDISTGTGEELTESGIVRYTSCVRIYGGI